VIEWLRMGGHGFYIWWSYGALALAVAIELWLLRRRRAQAVTEARQAGLEENG
jgi:heme exporter protein CcmD